MTGVFATALTGFFVLSGLGGTPVLASANEQASQEPAYPAYSVSMTAYNAVPAQTDSDPSVTASGAFSDPDVVAARSVDLADELPFGTVIAVSAATSSPNCGISVVGADIGLRVVADSMHPRKRNQIDILFSSDETVRVGKKEVNKAVAFGVCKDVTVTVVGHIDVNHMPKTQAELKMALGKSPLAAR